MGKPDFRTAATVKLKAERSRALSANVLRLIHDEPSGRIGTLGSPATWKAAIRFEEKRFARYRTPLTLVVAELCGLEAVTAAAGRDAADRLIHSVGVSIRRRTRSTDVVAREGAERLVAMLPETDEISAINCVERVRSQCDAWLEETALPLRLALGWAEPAPGAPITEAISLAERRMKADRDRLRALAAARA